MPERRTPLTLLVLALLAERAMHPYGMVQVIRQRQKTSIVNISQRNSIYQVIDRLVRAGLAEVGATERDENRPERTVYRITDAGSAAVRDWLREGLATGKPEFPMFPAALSLLALLTPADVLDSLDERLDALEHRRSADAASNQTGVDMGLPRIFLLDDEYRLAMVEAEIAWLRGVLAALRSGDMTWDLEFIQQVSARFEPPAI